METDVRINNSISHSSGFTIVEMLVVVMLTAMLAGIGGGFYVKSCQKLLTGRAARGFYTTLRYARVAAIEKQSDCKVVIDSERQGYWLSLNIEHEELSGEVQEVVVRDVFSRPVTFADGITFEAVLKDSGVVNNFEQDFGQENVIVFYSDGSADSAVVQIGNGKDHFYVQVSGGTGRVKIFEGQAEEMQVSKVDLDLQ